MLGSGNGARSTDFELDVETWDAQQNNPETGSQNRTRAEQQTKHDQAQDRTPTENAPATSARRTRQAQPEGTGRKPDTSFTVYILGGSGSWVGALSLWWMPGRQSSLHHAPCLEVGDIRTGCLRRRLEFGHDRC